MTYSTADRLPGWLLGHAVSDLLVIVLLGGAPKSDLVFEVNCINFKVCVQKNVIKDNLNVNNLNVNNNSIN